MRKFILIRWQDCIETVDAQLGPNPKDKEIEQVTTYYPARDRMVTCKTTSHRCINNDNSQQITIRCSMEENPTVVGDPKNVEAFGPPEDWYWGTWNITVATDLNSAKAEWSDDNPKYNGKALQCTVLSQELFKKSELEFVFRKKREQAEFRKELLRLDPHCAITDEKTQAVLEAAHIIDNSKNGAESISNGILLRADIHRLYDAGLFEIRQDGSIEISDCVSPEYQRILKTTKVDTNIISRVKKALAQRELLQNKRQLAGSAGR